MGKHKSDQHLRNPTKLRFTVRKGKGQYVVQATFYYYPTFYFSTVYRKANTIITGEIRIRLLKKLHLNMIDNFIRYHNDI